MMFSNPKAGTLFYTTRLLELTNFLASQTSNFYLFTDGFTEKSSIVSGMGIYAWDGFSSNSFHLPLPILSYGNNYMAELAALSLATITIYSDSLSSILASENLFI